MNERCALHRSRIEWAVQEAFSCAHEEYKQRAGKEAPIPSKDNLKITRLETIPVKPRWLFLKVHTNAGIMELWELITEGRALTCATGAKEVEPYLAGQDPHQVVHHLQTNYRHAFYRGGPILASVLLKSLLFARRGDSARWPVSGAAQELSH